MIETLLLCESNGKWTIPNSLIAKSMDRGVKICAEKCENSFKRIEILGHDKADIRVFKEGLFNLKGRFTSLNQRLSEFHQVPLDDTGRQALTEQLMQVAVAVRELKIINANPHLLEEGDRVYVDDLLLELTQTVGKDPREETIDAPSKPDMHALHFAARSGQKEVLELLLERGAKVDAADNLGL